MRPILAFDTSTDHIAIGVGDLDRPDAVLGTADMAAPRAANTMLLSVVEGVLAGAGLTPASIAAVACGRGPGSFTGVRIGVATAKGLAHGAGIPLAGFSTLDAVAWRVWRSGLTGERRLLGILGDAMRGEVYPALFEVSPDGVRRLTVDRVAVPGDVAREWAAYGTDLTIAGTALTKHRDVFGDAIGECLELAPPAAWVPDGRSLLDAAWAVEGASGVRTLTDLESSEAYRVAHPSSLLPIYTRLSDAEEAERRAAGGAMLQTSEAGGTAPASGACDAVTPDSGVIGPGAGER